MPIDDDVPEPEESRAADLPEPEADWADDPDSFLPDYHDPDLALHNTLESHLAKLDGLNTVFTHVLACLGISDQK